MTELFFDCMYFFFTTRSVYMMQIWVENFDWLTYHGTCFASNFLLLLNFILRHWIFVARGDKNQPCLQNLKEKKMIWTTIQTSNTAMAKELHVARLSMYISLFFYNVLSSYNISRISLLCLLRVSLVFRLRRYALIFGILTDNIYLQSFPNWTIYI